MISRVLIPDFDVFACRGTGSRSHSYASFSNLELSLIHGKMEQEHMWQEQYVFG